MPRSRVRLLLERNARVDARTTFGSTALFEATDRGHFDVVRLLLASRADVSLGVDQRTPLSAALDRKHHRIAEVLRQHIAARPARESLLQLERGVEERWWVVVLLVVQLRADSPEP